jgi:D-3-phosphoglycerate dehydrogenase / 2-oxoglutarate reductase
MKILLTTTSFQDTPGEHHELLNSTGYHVDKLRGPVSEDVLLPIIENYDGVICGDDEFSYDVIEKGKNNNLKVISKYGVGLDMIDLKAAKKFEIPVFNTPGVNQVTVAEHALSLMLTYLKNIHFEYNITRKGGWKRLIGNEIYGKKVGILGLGKIGKELAKRLSVFGVEMYTYDLFFDETFINEYSIIKVNSIEDLVLKVDILSIHMPLTNISKHAINLDIIKKVCNPLIIVNTSRALILDQQALIYGLDKNKINAYLTDVMDGEPMREDHPLKDYDNVLITPHIGSRTHESVVRQGSMAVSNLFTYLLEKYDN